MKEGVSQSDIPQLPLRVPGAKLPADFDGSTILLFHRPDRGADVQIALARQQLATTFAQVGESLTPFLPTAGEPEVSLGLASEHLSSSFSTETTTINLGINRRVVPTNTLVPSKIFIQLVSGDHTERADQWISGLLRTEGDDIHLVATYKEPGERTLIQRFALFPQEDESCLGEFSGAATQFMTDLSAQVAILSRERKGPLQIVRAGKRSFAQMWENLQSGHTPPPPPRYPDTGLKLPKAA